MKKSKKIIGCFLAVVFIVITTACGNNDKTWALKHEKNIVPNGVYLYFLFDSYNNAVERLSQDGSTIENIESQKIDDKPVSDWVQDNAIDACKNMLVIEHLFDEAGLSLSEETNQQIEEETNCFWECSSEQMEKCSISKDDFKRAYPITTAKTKQLFDSIFGKTGTDAVSDEELLNYYKTTFVNISLLTKVSNESLADDETSAEKVPIQTDTQIENQFKNYVDMINNEGKAVEEVGNLFKASENLEDSPLETEVMNPNDSDISEDIKNILLTLQVGKAAYTKLSDTFIFLYRNDMNSVELNLNDESERQKTLQDMKFNEFEEIIENKKNSLKIDINKNSIKDYSPIETFKES